jgi:His-Xaa-Ser system protein HxsD
MTLQPAGALPADLCTFDAQGASVELRVDAALYPLTALYGAAYVFIDRAFVLLGREDATHWRATLAWKRGTPPEGALRELAGEFMNELLSCAWRAGISEESRSILEAVTAQAFAGAMGPPALDDLDNFDFSEDALDDPLGIAMSWEEKYGKAKSADAKGDVPRDPTKDAEPRPETPQATKPEGS